MAGREQELRLYHTTTWENAREIFAGGFKDSKNRTPVLSNLGSGVWLADRPLYSTGLPGVPWEVKEAAVLVFKIPEDVVRPFGVDEDPAEPILGYRAFHLPAEVLNRYPIITVRSRRASRRLGFFERIRLRRKSRTTVFYEREGMLLRRKGLNAPEVWRPRRNEWLYYPWIQGATAITRDQAAQMAGSEEALSLPVTRDDT